MIEETTERPSLLIFYEHFFPAYKAGGPIQSLNNLVQTLEETYSISVITSAFDLHGKQPLEEVRTNQWNTVILPGCNFPITVWYAAKGSPRRKKLRQLIYQVNPAFVYLNGIFSYRFFMLPLAVIKRLAQTPKIVICPRGMLHKGALAGKSMKKKLYLKLLSFSGLLKAFSSSAGGGHSINTDLTKSTLEKHFWHVTNEEEKEDVIRVFGKTQLVKVAGNIPKKPVLLKKHPQKETGKLHLVYLSLIAEKKNLLLVLQALKKCDGITLDIYGFVKDATYWKECKKVISQMPGVVEYKGEVIPEKVQETFERYDASILLTRGENFGHALYESLSVGRPVITSHFTPWINLQQQKAGWNVDIYSYDATVILLKHLCNMPPNIFNEYCDGAHAMAINYYSQLDSLNEYSRLFS